MALKKDLSLAQIEQTAEDIFHWAQDAVMDMAEGISATHRSMSADEVYEDPDIMGDLYGDKIYDAANGDWVNMVLIAKKIMDYKHGASCKALAVKVKQWEELVEKYCS